MVDINWTVFIQMANFLALIFILNVLLYKPILRILERRQAIYDSTEAEIKGLQETIDKKMAEYEAKIQAAKTEAMNQRAGIQKEGAEKGKVIIDAAKADIQKMMDEFQAAMGKEIDSARAVLRSQSEAISRQIAEKVLGRSI